MGEQSADHSNDIRKKIYFILSAAVLLVLGVFFASTPVNAHYSGETQTVANLVKEISPQGWGFFTKDPREPFLVAYIPDRSEKWVNVTRGPNALPKNAFGLNRESRLDEYDLSQLIGTKDLEKTWVDCTGANLVGCAESAATSQGVQKWKVVGYDLRLCGDVLLLRQEPIPLDYAGLEYKPKTQAIRVNATCASKGHQ